MKILSYHSISEEFNDPVFGQITVNPSLFKRQLSILTRFGFRFMTPQHFNELLTSDYNIPKKTVLLTFDDGYKDFIKNAFPLLIEYKISAIVFIVTGLVGKVNEWDIKKGSKSIELLDLNELKELEEKEIMLGSHSVSHADLTSLSMEDLKKEINDTLTFFEENGLRLPLFFLYPYGLHNYDVVRKVKEAGFLGAFSTDSGSFRNFSDKHLIPRIQVHRNDSPIKLLFRVLTGGITDGLKIKLMEKFKQFLQYFHFRKRTAL
jgi:peptidoglycan/xylan/chitin deacetylase (PgdA/CDA1 family)